MEKRTFIKNLLTFGVAAVTLPRLSLAASGKTIYSTKMNAMVKARYSEELPDKMVKCLLCPHACVLKDGQSGICRTRQNEDGVLYSKAYGNPVAIHLDPVEKKPLFHFLPSSKVLSFGTAGCNLRCLNCQNADISQVTPDDIPALDYSPEKIVKTALEHSADGIAFTYTEPTVFFEYMYDTAFLAKEAGIKTIMISNGFINREPLNELLKVIDAFNIDLKAFDESIYRNLCGGQLEPVLNTILAICESGKWLEITNLMVTGYTDNAADFGSMADWLVRNGFSDVPLHLSRFFPAHKLMDSQPTSIEAMEKCYKTALDAGLNYVYTGNLRTEAHENTFCPKCKQLLVSRSGYHAEIVGLNENRCSKCGLDIPGFWSK